MNHRVIPAVAATVLALATLAGCGTATNGGVKAASARLTFAHVRAAIQTFTVTKTVSHVQILRLNHIEGQSFAIASFEAGGTRQYVGVVKSDKGTGSGLFPTAQAKGSPLQAGQLFQNGYTLIFGRVGGSVGAQRVLLTFATGKVRSVRVRQGYFWFFGRVGPSTASDTLTHIIGVSKHGQLVINSSRTH
jgi:hypothetical protein